MGDCFEDEDLIEQCVEVMRHEQKASVALLQRRLRLGYHRAALIMDELELRGFVGPEKRNSEPRDILFDLQEKGKECGATEVPAAPELIGLLKEAERFIALDCDVSETDDDGGGLLKAIRACIAKAEKGKQ